LTDGRRGIVAPPRGTRCVSSCSDRAACGCRTCWPPNETRHYRLCESAPKALKHLSRYEALILDDLGYVQQNREAMEVLFTLLADRYERGSVMLTSNLPFSQWEQIFSDSVSPR